MLRWFFGFVGCARGENPNQSDAFYGVLWKKTLGTKFPAQFLQSTCLVISSLSLAPLTTNGRKTYELAFPGLVGIVVRTHMVGHWHY